jgi:hypothetical protein
VELVDTPRSDLGYEQPVERECPCLSFEPVVEPSGPAELGEAL